jgi:hypothetical protein
MRYISALALAWLTTASTAQVVDGPDAPDLSIGYDGSALLFTLSDPPGSNNELQAYVEQILPQEPSPDPFWRFQGYAVFELDPADLNGPFPLHTLIRDADRAPMVVQCDMADDIIVPDLIRILGTDSCYADGWVLPNNGLTQTMAATISPRTGQPWDPQGQYCFAALAFATTPVHTDTVCGLSQTMLFSRKAPIGAVQVHCISPATVGVDESTAANVRVWPNPVCDVLHIDAQLSGPCLATCADAQGRLVRQQRVHGNSGIPVADLSPGLYQLRVRTDGGRILTQRFVVERNGR